MERYERYKDSGVEWLGEVPGHWNTLRMKYAFNERSQKGFSNEPLLSATQMYGVIPQSLYENRTVVATKGLETLKLVLEGDFIISLRSFQGGLEYAHYRGIISPAYTVLEPKKIDAQYFRYLGKSNIFVQLLKSCVTGIREGQNIDYSVLRENRMPIPPSDEQGRIVAFLDEKCGQIDRAVEQKERMIELLQERRAATIQRAVTQGLDPTLPLKDSNIDWIGKIPIHWQIKKLKNLGRNFNGLTYSPNDLCDSESGTLVIRSSNVQNDKLSLDDNVYVSKRISNELLVRKGDIIICSRNGSASLIGKAALIESDITATFGAFMMIFKGNSNINKKYLYYLITVCIKQYKGLFSTSTINQLTNSMLGDIYTPFVAEEIKQQEIATYLDKVSTKTEQAIKLKRQEIERLKEYRQTLINSAVTGKIKID